MYIRFLQIGILLFSLFGLLHSQINPSTLSQFSNLTPEERKILLQNKTDASGSERIPTTEFPRTEVLVDKPSRNSFEDRSEFLDDLNRMERVVVDDIEQLEKDLIEIDSAKDNELLEALEESRSLLDKIKNLKRQEIEKRAEEYAQSKFDAIKPFGYDLFASVPDTFAPGNEVPMPSNYIVGPGDLIEIQLFGKKNASYSLQISSDGLIQFPQIGPINAFEKGTSFVDLKNHLREKILENFGGGTQTSIYLGGFRSIRVFLMGEVRSPGAYTVSALSTMINAILSCGGIKESGSLRKIELKRSGELITTLDLYDLLLSGNTSADRSLQPGDVIFVPIVRKQITISGSVKRPAKYEILGDETLSDAILLAGGPADRALMNLIRLERLGNDFRPKVLNLSLSEDGGLPLSSGDLISAGIASTKLNNSVSLIGACEKVGDFEWKPGLKLGDLVDDPLDLNSDADLNYGLIRRNLPNGKIECYSFVPADVVSKKQSSDIELKINDLIYFFPRRERADLLSGLFKDLRSVSEPGDFAKLVSITGVVHFPGEYPLTENMTAADLIQAAGGAKDSSYMIQAELSRKSIDSSQNSFKKHIPLTRNQLIDTNNSQKFVLEPYDSLFIKPIPSWRETEQIELAGELKFEGNYSIKLGETLFEVIKRAGGLTDRAYADGAIFSRENLRIKEDQQRERLIKQLESDLATITLDATDSDEVNQATSAARAMLSRLRNTESQGRLVIDLNEILKAGEDSTILVKDKDSLFIPSIPYAVSVTGEIQFPTSHLYDEKLDMNDYLNRSGGYTQNADKDRTFVVKANGAVMSKGGNGWFVKGSTGNEISPGDVIVVPIDIKQTRFLENLTYSTQIIYQLAVAAAAVNSF